MQEHNITMPRKLLQDLCVGVFQGLEKRGEKKRDWGLFPNNNHYHFQSAHYDSGAGVAFHTHYLIESL